MALHFIQPVYPCDRNTDQINDFHESCWLHFDRDLPIIDIPTVLHTTTVASLDFLYFSCIKVAIHQYCSIYRNITNNSIEHLTDESLLETMFLHFAHKEDLCTQERFAIVTNQCKRSVI